MPRTKKRNVEELLKAAREYIIGGPGVKTVFDDWRNDWITITPETPYEDDTPLDMFDRAKTDEYAYVSTDKGETPGLDLLNEIDSYFAEQSA